MAKEELETLQKQRCAALSAVMLWRCGRGWMSMVERKARRATNHDLHAMGVVSASLDSSDLGPWALPPRSVPKQAQLAVLLHSSSR